jgi:hypothetical protein
VPLAVVPGTVAVMLVLVLLAVAKATGEAKLPLAFDNCTW